MMTTMDGTELRAPADDVGAADTVDALVERLYHAEAPRLVQMARWFVDDTTAAEDLVQEAFIRLSHNGHRIREQDRAAAYLRSIVINLARDHNRRGLVSLRHRPPAQSGRALGGGPRRRRRGHRRGRRRRCATCLDDSATAWCCATTSTCRSTTSPTTLGVSRNSVKTHLSRGLKNLSAQLGDTAMSQLEDRLRRTLAADTSGTPSPDLFARVRDSIEDDRARRRSRTRWLLGAAAVLALAVATVLTLTPYENGRPAMPWWTLELFTTGVLVAIALWLGPFIKRFGRAYAADVFHDNPLTGKSYIVLTDIVYYLIFAAFILFTVRFEPDRTWGRLRDVNADQIEWQLQRVGGILLVIGVLHGLNIVLMPVLGRLFSLNRRLSGSHER